LTTYMGPLAVPAHPLAIEETNSLPSGRSGQASGGHGSCSVEWYPSHHRDVVAREKLITWPVLLLEEVRGDQWLWWLIPVVLALAAALTLPRLVTTIGPRPVRLPNASSSTVPSATMCFLVVGAQAGTDAGQGLENARPRRGRGRQWQCHQARSAPHAQRPWWPRCGHQGAIVKRSVSCLNIIYKIKKIGWFLYRATIRISRPQQGRHLNRAVL
jgi:hypothetical protein